MIRILLIAFSLFIFTCSFGQWQFEYVDFGGKPSLTVSDSGDVHMAYMLESTTGWMNYAARSESNWNIETIQTAYYYGPLDIELDNMGLPLVAAHDHDEEDQVVFRIDTDGNWLEEFTEHPGHDGWDNSLAIDSSGRIHAVSSDPISQSGIEYSIRDSSEWRTEKVIDAGSTFYGRGTGFALDNEDRPAITYFLDDTDDLAFAQKNGAEWQISVIESQGDVGRFSSLVYHQDQFHVAYLKINNGTNEVRYARYQGSSWQITTIDTLDHITIGSRGARDIIELVSFEDELHICYGDQKVISYGKQNADDSWQLESILDFTEDTLVLGQQVSFAIDASGDQHLCYYHLGSVGPVSGDIYYAYRARPVMEEPEMIISGNILCPNGGALKDVKLSYIDGLNDTFSVHSDNEGYYELHLPIQDQYEIDLARTSSNTNATTGADLVRLRRFLLGSLVFEEWQQCAADYNDSGTISTFDIVKILKSILGLTERRVDYLFLPENPEYNLQGSKNRIRVVRGEAMNIEADLIGVLPGDVNGSVCD